jgi:hypothetical protein
MSRPTNYWLIAKLLVKMCWVLFSKNETVLLSFLFFSIVTTAIVHLLENGLDFGSDLFPSVFICSRP